MISHRLLISSLAGVVVLTAFYGGGNFREAGTVVVAGNVSSSVSGELADPAISIKARPMKLSRALKTDHAAIPQRAQIPPVAYITDRARFLPAETESSTSLVELGAETTRKSAYSSTFRNTRRLALASDQRPLLAQKPRKSSRATPQPDAPVRLPAVLLPPDAKISLTAPQAEQWEALQEDFVNAVGGPDQDANDPASRTRWIGAQAMSDQMFRLKFGTTAFLLQSFAASQQDQP